MGKKLSLSIKILSVAFALLAFFLTNKPIDDIIKMAVFIALTSSPVDISFWIKNFKSKI